MLGDAMNSLEEFGLTREQVEETRRKTIQLQNQYQQHLLKQKQEKIGQIQAIYNDLNVNQCELALSICNDDEQEVLARLEKHVDTRTGLWEILDIPDESISETRESTLDRESNQPIDTLSEPSTYTPLPEEVKEDKPKPKTKKKKSHDTQFIPRKRQASEPAEKKPKKQKKPTVDGTEITCIQEEIEGMTFEDIIFPIILPTCNSVIMSLGRFKHLENNDWWCSPSRVGFHAVKQSWGCDFHMYILECATTGKPVFKVGIPEKDRWFYGYTPTDPWTKWCCDLSKTGNGRASGPYFYGFSDYKLQRILRRMILATDEDEYRYRLGGLGIQNSPEQDTAKSSKAYQSSAKLKANNGGPAQDAEFQIRGGDWTEEERLLLLQHVEKHKSKPKIPWGMVSIGVPGRTGFMCQGEYNNLCKRKIQIGQWKLPLVNVAIEEPHVPTESLLRGLTNMGMKKQADPGMGKKTRRTFMSGGGRFKVKMGRLEAAGETLPEEEKKKRKVARLSSEDSESDLEELEPEKDDVPGVESPCPDLKDAITFLQMRQPSICPCGYVCDHSNWIRILAGGNTLNENVLFGEEGGPASVKDTCPFTKQHHTRRMIVKLTFDNWDYYKDKIREI